MARYLDDVFVLFGCGLILYGVYRIIPEAVWFVSGIMLILAGILIGAGNRKSK